MRDVKIFTHCTRQLEKGFGIETERVMLSLAGIINAELSRLENCYDKEAAEALSNLYYELHRAGERISRNVSVSRRHKDYLEEFLGRGLNAALSPNLTQRNIVTYRMNGDLIIALESRHPRTALMMVRVYHGRVPDFDYSILRMIETQTNSDGLPVYAKQPIKLDL